MTYPLNRTRFQSYLQGLHPDTSVTWEPLNRYARVTGQHFEVMSPNAVFDRNDDLHIAPKWAQKFMAKTNIARENADRLTARTALRLLGEVGR